MRLIDTETGGTLGLEYLKEEYEALRRTEPENHQSTFKAELLEILLATVNGRNDCEITGLTAREVNRYILRLRPMVNS